MFKFISFQNIKYCVIHHSGGLVYAPKASTQHLTAEDIDKYHKECWPDFVSSLGFWGLYNFFIDKTGKITQFRQVGEPTGAQIGHNQDSISICLAGNFTEGVDMPLPEQVKSLKNLMGWAMDNGIKLQNIVPHRFLGLTQCYGTGLLDSWARDMMKERIIEKIGLLKQLLNLYLALFDLIRKGEMIIAGMFKLKLKGKFWYIEDSQMGPDRVFIIKRPK